MLTRLRFRSTDDARRAEHVLEQVLPSFTVLPGGMLAVPDTLLAAAGEALTQAGLEFRQEPVEEFLGGRYREETRDEGEPFGSF